MKGVVSTVMAVVALAVGVLADAPASGQGGAPASTPWTGPRTPDGQPDVQGLWDAAGVGIETLQNIEDGADPVHSTINGQKVLPADVIVDPPSKKIPYQPWAEAQRQKHYAALHNGDATYRDPVYYCRMMGVPRVNYQGSVRILQVPGYIVLTLDSYHIARIVPLDNRPRLAENVKLWMGESRGRWEGSTLVIDVRNQNGKFWFDWAGNFASEGIHVVERWTFTDGQTARYEATIEDPKMYTQPWKMAMTFRKQEYQEPWEEACWEGQRH
jgi:hypothetical protein